MAFKDAIRSISKKLGHRLLEVGTIKNKTSKKLSKNEINTIRTNVRTEIDKLYEELINPFNTGFNSYTASLSTTTTDDDLQNDVKSWVRKNYGDTILRSRMNYYMRQSMIPNENINIDTGETEFYINDLSFYKRMADKDTRIHGAVWSLINNVVSRKWEIKPPLNTDNAIKMADFIEDVFKNKLKDFAENIQNLAMSIIYGFSIQEVIWDNTNDGLIPTAIEYRDPDDFEFKYGDTLWLKPRYNTKSLQLPINKFLIHSYNGTGLNPYGESILGERIFWMYYFKRIVWRFRFRFLERFGNPLMIHEYQDETERLMMNEALTYMASKGAIQVPAGSKITPVEVVRNTEDFRDAINDIDKNMEIAIVGQTATMAREQGGSYASDYIRQDQFYTKVNALLISMESSIDNQLIKPIIKLNFPKAKNFPRFVSDKLDDVLKIKETERNLSLIRQGAPLKIIPEFKRLGLPIPEDIDPDATFNAYYSMSETDIDRHIRGGMPPEIRHQIRASLDDERLADVDTSYYEDENDNKDEEEVDENRKDNQKEKRNDEKKVKDDKKGKPKESKGKANDDNQLKLDFGK